MLHTVNTLTVSNKTTNTIVTLEDGVKTQLNEAISFVSFNNSDKTYNDDDLSYDSSIVSMPQLLQRTTSDLDSSSDGCDDSASCYVEDNKDIIVEWLNADDEAIIKRAHFSLSLKADDDSIVSNSSSIAYININNDITANNDVARTNSSIMTTTTNLVSVLSKTNVDTNPVPTTHFFPVVVLPLPTMNTFESNKTVDDHTTPNTTNETIYLQATIDLHRLLDARGRERSRSSSNKRSSSKYVPSKSRSPIIDLSSSNICIANITPRTHCSSNSLTHQRHNNDSDTIISTDYNNIIANVAYSPASTKQNTSLDSTFKSLKHHRQNNDHNIITNNGDVAVLTNVTPSLESISHKDTRSLLNMEDQNSTRQSDSLSIDELQILVNSSKNYISTSLKQAVLSRMKYTKVILNLKLCYIVLTILLHIVN